jgi:hypothetical protein
VTRVAPTSVIEQRFDYQHSPMTAAARADKELCKRSETDYSNPEVRISRVGTERGNLGTIWEQ